MQNNNFNDFEQIFDIYDYYYVYPWQHTYFKVGLAIVIVFLLVAVTVFIFWKKMRKPPTVWEWALNELSRLDVDKCKTKDDFKDLYFSLTKIVKKYLFLRYGWNVFAKTDDELLKFLKKKRFDKFLIDAFNEILQKSLYIKFANESALRSDARKALLWVKDFVKSTIPHQEE